MLTKHTRQGVLWRDAVNVLVSREKSILVIAFSQGSYRLIWNSSNLTSVLIPPIQLQ